MQLGRPWAVGCELGWQLTLPGGETAPALSASWVRPAAVVEVLDGGGLSQDTVGALSLIWGVSEGCSYPGERRYLLS